MIGQAVVHVSEPPVWHNPLYLMGHISALERLEKFGYVQLLLHALLGWASVPAHGPRCMRREGLLQFIAGGRFGCETEV